MMAGTVAGGFVLLAYMAAIALCLAARGVTQTRADTHGWAAIAIILALLAIEKAIHVESHLVELMERIAIRGGWYESRAGVQIAAIELLAVIGVLLTVGMIRLSRRARLPTRIAAAMAVVLVAFVSIRAVSLHQMDRLLSSGVGPLRVSNVVELAALCVIGGAAAAVVRGRRPAELPVDK